MIASMLFAGAVAVTAPSSVGTQFVRSLCEHLAVSVSVPASFDAGVWHRGADIIGFSVVEDGVVYPSVRAVVMCVAVTS